MEKYKKGGYTILDLESSTIYADSVKALDSNKPIVVYDGTNKPYFADTIVLSGTSVVITKGGKTITIANDNTITSSGDVLTIMENIVDSQGNNRFVDGDLTPATISGIEFTYSKWSLSGSHLMVVLCANIESGTELTNNQIFAQFTLPDYINDKLVPIIGTTINYYYCTFVASDYTQVTKQFRMIKGTPNDIRFADSLTAVKDYTIRIQFDLLIDADYSE